MCHTIAHHSCDKQTVHAFKFSVKKEKLGGFASAGKFIIGQHDACIVTGSVATGKNLETEHKLHTSQISS